jgi:hypothetical protein
VVEAAAEKAFMQMAIDVTSERREEEVSGGWDALSVSPSLVSMKNVASERNEMGREKRWGQICTRRRQTIG